MGRIKSSSSFVFILMLSVFSFQPACLASDNLPAGRPSACYAETVSSKTLIENAKALDGKIVKYEGEAITTILNRKEYSWINLNDGENAIGIWCRHSQLDAVRFVGDYKNKGDTLEIEGRFNRACPLHGGELDIHAESVKIIKEGYAIEEKTDSKKLNLAIAVFSIVLLIAVIFRKRL